MILSAIRKKQNKITGVALTDKGCRRQLNEDALELVIPKRSEILHSKGVLGILADGMGGHQAGEVASQMAVEIIKDVYYHHPDTPGQSLKQAFAEANGKIWNLSQEKEDCRGMGNTCSAVVILNKKIFFSHVGDSRIYRLQDGIMSQLSHDHTLEEELKKAGEECNPQHRHILSRAMGIGEGIDFQYEVKNRVKENDRYLICSDGLYDLVDDTELTELLSMKTIFLGAQSMIALAKDRGGHDNISVLILEIK